jgi:hypothetical protein
VESEQTPGIGGGNVHELLATYSSWSSSLYVWTRTVVGIVLWFWVVSGAIFGIRFLAFVLLDKNTGSVPLATGSAHMPFLMERFKEDSHANSSNE